MEGTPQLIDRRLQVQLAIARALAEARTVEETGALVLEAIGSRLGWSVGVLWEVDAQLGLLRPVAQWARPGTGCEPFTAASADLSFAPGVGLPGRVWESAQCEWIPDLAADENFARMAPAAQAGLRSGFGVPLRSEGEPVGVMEFFGTAEEGPDQATTELLDLIGNQLGLFLQHRRAHVRARETERLHAATVAAALDCVIAMDAEGRVVDFNPAAEATFGYAREEAIGRELAELIVPPALRNRHREALERYRRTGEGRLLGRRLELTGCRADGSEFPVELTIVRIPGREPPLFTGFVRDVTERRRADAEITRLLAREQAARRLAEEAQRQSAEIAMTLQRSLLPPELPAIPGLDAAAVFRASGETVVGGDFYDVFAAAEDRWSVAIGDVVGKGPQAASVTALARHTIRAAAMGEASPGAILRVLNEALLRSGDGATHCTAIYACVAPADGGMRFDISGGGHPPPLLLRDGEVEAISLGGTLLGAFPDPRVEDRHEVLAPGDMLLLYTDGVTDVRTPEGLFGTARLAEAFAACRGCDAETIAARVQAAVVDPPEHRVRDDVAILVLRAT